MSKNFDFLSLAKSRKTTYEFSEKEISDSDIIKILEAARWAPNAGNIQPWHFIIIKDKTKIEQLLDSTTFIHFPFINPAPNKLIVFILDKEELSKHHLKNRSKERLLEDSKMCVGMAALQSTLQAESLKISSCILTPNPLEAANLLNLKKGKEALLFVGYGYEKKNGSQKKT